MQCRIQGSLASKSIPRGYHPVYTPCLDSECAALLKQYEETGDAEVADHLIESMNAARLARWERETSKMDFTRSSRKCWILIRRLGDAQDPPTRRHSSVNPNQVASHIMLIIFHM